jgi:DNA-binding beta-propeller fold protein YncE
MSRQLVSPRERSLLPLARRAIILAALAGLALGGCGSSSGEEPDARVPDARPIEFPPATCDAPAEPPAEPPAGVHIVFPPGPGLTRDAAITVRGTALLDGDVAAIRVNGVLADTADGFRHWQVSVPLAPGENAIKVESEDAAGQIDPEAAQTTVVSGPTPMLLPTAVALDAGNDRALVVDAQRNALLAVDLITGLRTIVYEPQRAKGDVTALGVPPPPPPLDSLTDVALLDAAAERALVLATGQVFALDLATGAPTTISDAETGSGPALTLMIDMALDEARGRVLVLDQEADALAAVDLTTGARSLISDAATGSGPSLAGATGVALDAQAGRALVATNLDQPALLAVDLTTGARTVLSGASRGAGPALTTPEDVVLDAANQRAIVSDTSFGRLIAVDLATGDRSLVLEPQTSSGFVLGAPAGLALDEAQERLLVLDQGRKSLLAVDLAARQRTVVSGDAIGGGVELQDLGAFAVDAERGRVLVLDALERQLVAVDRGTGARSVISGETVGDGPSLGAAAIALDASRQRALVANISEDVIVAVDLATGQRTVLSGNDVGAGPALAGPQSLLLDDAGGRVLVGTVTGLVAVDLDTGDRTPVFQDVGYVNWLADDPACDRVLFTGGGAAPTRLYAADVATGKVSVVDGSQCPAALDTLAHDPRSGKLVVWQGALPGLLTLDTRTARCTMVTVEYDLAEGSPADGEMLLDPATGVLLFTNGFTQSLQALDPETGARVILSR